MADKLRQVPYDIRQCRLIVSSSGAPVLVAQQPGAVIILWAPFWAFWCGVVGGSLLPGALGEVQSLSPCVYSVRLPRVYLCRIGRGVHCILSGISVAAGELQLLWHSGCGKSHGAWADGRCLECHSAVFEGTQFTSRLCGTYNFWHLVSGASAFWSQLWLPVRA